GRLTASRGALSLRTGNFFAGTDAERMRITAAGDVGIGVEQPAAKLDVAGLIRTSEGIVFPDGTIQKTAAGPGAGRNRLSSDRTAQGEGEQKEKAARGIPGPNQVNISGAGTTNQITKWADGPGGVVGDSTISEVGGDIGIGTSSPGGVFDVQRASAGDILQRLWNTGTGGAKLRYVAATGQTSQLQLTDGIEWLMAIAGNNSIGMQFRVRNTSDPNSEAALASAARMTILRNGKVGIGTTNPQSLLEVISGSQVGGDIEVAQYGSSSSPSIFGRRANGTIAAPSAVQSGNVLASFGGRAYGATGFSNGATGRMDVIAAENWTNAAIGTAITFSTTMNGTTSSSTRMRIDHNGNVGIGTNTPTSFKLQVAGSVGPDTDSAGSLGDTMHRWTAVYAVNGTIQTSDARLKKSVTNLGYGLSEVMQLRPVSFEWKDRRDTRTYLGLIAQEVERIIPEAVERDKDPATPLGMSYTSLVPVLINAVQEQQAALDQKEAAIKSLRAENAALKEHNAELDARLTALEQALQQLIAQQSQTQPTGRRQ